MQSYTQMRRGPLAGGTVLLAAVALAIGTGPAVATITPAEEGDSVGAASAGSVIGLSGTTLVIDGGPADNDISMGGHSALPKFIMDNAGVTAGAGCRQLDWNEVECPAWDSGRPDYSRIVARLGDGNDQLAMGLAGYNAATVDGGPGNDVVYGTDSGDNINGGAGSDYVTGSSGFDTVNGGAGSDQVYGGSESDWVSGGPGRDSVDGSGPAVLDDGNDQLELVDGERDQAQCGFGADIVRADKSDVVDSVSCEAIRRPSTTKSMVLTVDNARSKMKIKKLLAKGYRYNWQASAKGEYRASLKVAARKAHKIGLSNGGGSVIIASKDGAISTGTHRMTLRVKKAKYRSALRDTGKVKVKLRMVASGGRAGDDTYVERVTLRG